MTCEDVVQNEVAEKYVAGHLASAEQDAYEAHYFECKQCLASLQLLQSMQARLAREPASPSSSMQIWRWAIAAALALAAFGVWRLHRTVAPPAVAVQVAPTAPAADPNLARYDLLARIDPPVYRESTLRGANEAQAKFRDAMHHYQSGDYAGAIPGLKEASQLDPKASGALFFLGVSQLLAGERAEGMAELRNVAAMNESLEAADAHFYLGQALLGDHDVDGAVSELKKSVAEKSEHAKDAQRLIAAIQGAP